LTDKQRQAVFAAFGPETNMQLYGRGIRRRLAPMLAGDRRRLELAYSLMMTLPGTVVLHYGDEIGMGDDLRLPERNCARTPMQWSVEPHGGFTKSDGPVLPVISGGAYGFEHVNVAQQRRDPNSLLNWTERIIRMRKEVPEIGWGDFTLLDAGTPEVLALRYDWRDNSVVMVHNLSAVPREIHLTPGSKNNDNRLLVNVLSDDNSQAAVGTERHTILMEPYGYRWYRVGGLDYLLRRE
jgi:maltose alpha-D-glucosyltransferase/alpha-amylase